MIWLLAGAFAASLLTFFSGFGLGTVLLPIFAVFFPLPVAIAVTAIVHFCNNLFKAALVGKHAQRDLLVKFGIPALMFSFLGAFLMVYLTGFGFIYAYSMAGHDFEITWIKLTIAILIFAFTIVELTPAMSDFKIDRKYLPMGGAISGFFGGLSGHQGALRSMFLASLNLSKETFIGTGVVIALMIDIARLLVYSRSAFETDLNMHVPLIIGVTLSAFVGTWIGNRYLKKITMNSIQKIVAVCLLLFACTLGAGLI